MFSFFNKSILLRTILGVICCGEAQAMMEMPAAQESMMRPSVISTLTASQILILNKEKVAPLLFQGNTRELNELLIENSQNVLGSAVPPTEEHDSFTDFSYTGEEEMTAEDPLKTADDQLEEWDLQFCKSENIAYVSPEEMEKREKNMLNKTMELLKSNDFKEQYYEMLILASAKLVGDGHTQAFKEIIDNNRDSLLEKMKKEGMRQVINKYVTLSNNESEQLLEALYRDNRMKILAALSISYILWPDKDAFFQNLEKTISKWESLLS